MKTAQLAHDLGVSHLLYDVLKMLSSDENHNPDWHVNATDAATELLGSASDTVLAAAGYKSGDSQLENCRKEATLCAAKALRFLKEMKNYR